MYQPYRDAKSPPPSDLIAIPGEPDDWGACPVPVGRFAAPKFLPGTALVGFGIFGSNALFCFGGGGGCFLFFSNVLNSGTFFRSGGTTSSFLGCGGSGFTSFFQRLLEGSTTLLSFREGIFGIGTPLFPTSVTFTLSLPPPGPAQRLPCQWKYAESARSTISPPCNIPETVMYGTNRTSSVLAIATLIILCVVLVDDRLRHDADVADSRLPQRINHRGENSEGNCLIAAQEHRVGRLLLL